MKSNQIENSKFIILYMFLSMFVIGLDSDKCEMLSDAEINKIRLYDCCNDSFFVDKPTAQKLHREVLDEDSGPSLNFLPCIHATKLFKHEKALFSNGSIDIDAEKSSLRRHVKDQEWLNLFEHALPLCNQFSEENCDTIQSQQKMFTKEECNVKYIWTLWCMRIYGLANCPEHSLNDTATCYQDREILKKCFLHPYAMNKIESRYWRSED